MARLLSRLGAAAHRHRLAVVLGWLLVLVGAGVAAATLQGSTTRTFSIPGQESTEALERIERAFGQDRDDATAQVVVRAPDGQTLTAPENAAALAELLGTLGRLDGVASVTDPLAAPSGALSADQRTASSTVTYRVGPEELTGPQRDALMDALRDARGSGLTVEAAGEATQPVEGENPGEAIGVLVALLVLVVTYGALAVAGMNLFTALVGVGVGVLGIQVATGFLTLTSTTPALATMLGLAVGIDYALFIVSRFRHELRRGLPVGPAIATAVGTAGSAVVTAGVSVVIALVGLSVSGIPFIAQMGLAAAGTVVVAVLVALTLVPAMLAFLGRRALPRKERRAPADLDADGEPRPLRRERGFFLAWITGVTRHPLPAILLSVLVLGALSLPLISLRTTLVPAPAEGSTQARAEQLLTDAFGEGSTGPLTVLFEGAGAPGAATAAVDEIAGLADVAAVTPPVPGGDGTAALVTVVPASGPRSPATEALVDTLRDQLTDSGAVQVSVTGQTAVGVDVASTVNGALPVYLALVVGLAFVLLVLVFRSLLVPLVGVLGFLLSVGAALGSTVAVFQWGWLADPLGVQVIGPLISLTPILMVGILFGLAMDYQVFLVARMHEAHTQGQPAVTAVRTGFRQAAPVVVAAATIMFAVFAGFLPSDDATLQSVAFALASGILFDAFVVRMVLVPAGLALLGERSWWLPRQLRWLPALDVEGRALTGPGSPAPADRIRAGTH
ncbi:MMPL family transporter [Modestobacter sp. SYSU DS0290]